ncbi:MAG TPA: LLM class flavin-dependent oxidoreductase, partial [Candidatus Binataceae bacterium]|nr:LLM class flavin-dependent oxidoreductase [Candidatus Binataceae bacterium]
MKCGVYVQNFGEYGDPNKLIELAIEAEQAGWDGFFVWDHLLLYRHSDIPFVDAWVALAAIAARTDRLRLGPVVTPLARRRPWKVAREVVSLDHLSRGRAVLGVGLGAPPDAEFEFFGEDPSDRVRARKLDEALSVLDGLWRGEPFSHDGDYFHIKEVKFAPRPVQSPRVPVWVAGFWPNKPPMRRAARWDGVFPLKMPRVPLVGLTPGAAPWSILWLQPKELGEAVSYVRQHRTDAGPFDVIASGATPPGETAKGRELVNSFREAGATWWLEWLDETRGTFAHMREHIRKGPPR